MSDNLDETHRTYTIDPKYRNTWATWAYRALFVASGVVVFGVVVAIAGQDGIAISAFAVAAVLGLPALLVRSGVGVTDRHRYSLAVEPERMTVTWRDTVTHLPWHELEYGAVVENGPAFRALEVRPRPGVRYALPSNARPRPSTRRPGNIEVFILSMLGERQADCMGDVARYLDIR